MEKSSLEHEERAVQAEGQARSESMSLTKLLRHMTKAHGLPQLVNARLVNQKLRDLGLLEKEIVSDSEYKSSQWIVTERGHQRGIQQDFYRPLEDGGRLSGPRFTPQCDRLIYEVLGSGMTNGIKSLEDVAPDGFAPAGKLPPDYKTDDRSTSGKINILSGSSEAQLGEYLHRTNRELEQLLSDSSMDERCRCMLRFSSAGKAARPDYSSRAARLWYFFTYAYGYAYEYERMWRAVYNARGHSEMRVLSLGCGSGIDLWALRSALGRYHVSGLKRRYIGVDYYDWSDCAFDFCPIERWGQGKQGGGTPRSFYRWGWDAADYLESQTAFLDGALFSDVVVLPKSIGEFDDGAIARIARKLGDMSKDHALFLCICPAHARQDLDTLWAKQKTVQHRIDMLLEGATGGGSYELVEKGEDKWYDPGRHISELTTEGWWGYLGKSGEQWLLDATRSRCEACAHHAARDCDWWKERQGQDENSLRCPLDHSPITTGGYSRYRVYKIPKRS